MAELTWGDISNAFEDQYPNISELAQDYRPYRPDTLWVWLKDSLSIIVQYHRENGKCSIRTPLPGERWDLLI